MRSAPSAGLAPPSYCRLATAAAIAEVSKSAEGAPRIKFHSKTTALDLIAKHLGLYDHDAKHTGEIKVVFSERERDL